MKITFPCLHFSSFMHRTGCLLHIEYIFFNTDRYLIRPCVSKTLTADRVTVH